MDEDSVPEYPVPEALNQRIDILKTKFREHFQEEPLFFARAPGRVNLIGEHIDYCGYAVLPMALEQDIIMAVLPDRSGKLSLINTDPQYETYDGSVMNIQITKNVPHWYKYILCGIQGIKEQFCSIITQGFKAVVDGTIPCSAGLSSSSALVCCAALAMLRVNSWPLSKTQLSEVCAKCERYIGTEGGGMDQAISLTASAGKAKLVEFNPLKTTDVTLPGDAVFVVSNSLAEMNKAATPHFNVRVVECRLATQVLALKSGLKWREMKRLKDVQTALGVSLDDMVELVNSKLHKEPYSKDEVLKLLEVSSEELAETSLSANTLDVETFYLFQRAHHVYSEAKRVLQFKAFCDENPPDALVQLGNLMNESHASCDKMYDCSHPDLNTLVDACRKNGASGSRMTGAGWGGCGVSLVKSDAVEALLNGVRNDYYKLNPERLSKVDGALFATAPGGGAAYYLTS